MPSSTLKSMKILPYIDKTMKTNCYLISFLPLLYWFRSSCSDWRCQAESKPLHFNHWLMFNDQKYKVFEETCWYFNLIPYIYRNLRRDTDLCTAKTSSCTQFQFSIHFIFHTSKREIKKEIINLHCQSWQLFLIYM